MLNLSVLLEDSARRYPQNVAVVMNDTRLTYAQLNAAANQVAGALKSLGVQPGDKVALSCPNLPYFPIIYYGILKAGGVVVPLNVLLKRREIAYHLRDSDARVYFCLQDLPGLPMGTEGFAGFKGAETCEHFFVITADPAAPSPIEGVQTLGMLMHNQPPVFDTVQTAPGDAAVILYTSGTTGQPKGAELSHSNMVFNAIVSQGLLGTMSTDVQLIVLPLFHSMAQTVMMNSAFYAGATSVFLPRFEPEAVLKVMEKEGVTIFGGVPTMYWALLNYIDASGYNIEAIKSTLRVCGSGGASLPEAIMRRFESLFEAQILEGYGLSETSPAVCFNHRHGLRKVNSVGTPVWGVEVKIVDADGNEVPPGEPGELVVRGHNVMNGYYKRPEATAEAMRGGWLHTGDIAKVDEDGYYYIVDRLKDMILRGGYNVYPREVEEVLMTHPAISLAAVVGVPHEEYGEEIKAFVVLKEGASATPEEIIAWSKSQMAAYKYPRIVEIRDTLPMTATGKILKKELKTE
ncbi:MAG: long-chain fatty acid--CoA ligase [Caldilineae bacterium]|nr:MAG: long-chain fatty acid--CoA ligase [Caldilineae bacterium]